MTFAEELVQSANSSSAAFIQYVTQRGRFPSHLFIFVEEKDDIRFYTHFTHTVRDLIFLPAGCKTQVIDLYLRLSTSDRLRSRTAYIVDRDLDEEQPPRYEGDILQTRFYSWESHAAQTAVIEHFFSRFSHPPLTDEEKREAAIYWENSKEAFRDLLTGQAAGIRCSIARGGGFGFADFPVTQNATVAASTIAPSEQAVAWLAERVERLVDAGIEIETLERERNSFHGDVVEYGHGKTLFRVVKKYIEEQLRLNGAASLINFNSPLDFVVQMNPDWEEVGYVSQYLRFRQGI